MKSVLIRLKNLMIKIEELSVVEYVLLLTYIVVQVVVLVTLLLSNKELMEKTTCVYNRSQAYEKSFVFHEIECPVGGIITLVDGHL